LRARDTSTPPLSNSRLPSGMDAISIFSSLKAPSLPSPKKNKIYDSPLAPTSSPLHPCQYRSLADSEPACCVTVNRNNDKEWFLCYCTTVLLVLEGSLLELECSSKSLAHNLVTVILTRDQVIKLFRSFITIRSDDRMGRNVHSAECHSDFIMIEPTA
jgi:hypothetical protein